MTRNPGCRPIITAPIKEPAMTRTSTPTEFIKLTGALLRATEKAVHFRVEEVSGVPLEENVTHWFPISQISSQTTGDAEGRDHISVAKWICVQKELV